MPGLLSSIFTRSCPHEFSWPRRLGNSHYQVCLRCGEQYEYDWETLRRGEQLANKKVRTEPRLQREGWIRRPRRIHWVKPILYRQVGSTEWHSGTTQNISESGVLFDADHLLPDNADLEMVFEMPETIAGQSHKRIFCTGFVVRGGCSSSGPTLAAAISDYTFL